MFLERVLEFDRSLFLVINGFSGNLYVDRLMVLIAELTVFLVPAYLIYRWFSGVEGKKDGFYIFLSTVFSVMAGYFFGIFLTRPSPFQVYETVVSGAAENSFPSTHMAVMFGFMIPLFWRGSRKRFRYGFLIITILTGFARIFIGEHYPLDVLGSLVAAFAGFSLAFKLQSVDSWTKKVFEKFEEVERAVTSHL